MKSDELYNHADNIVYIKGDGDFINVICNTEKQMDEVVKRLDMKSGMRKKIKNGY